MSVMPMGAQARCIIYHKLGNPGEAGNHLSSNLTKILNKQIRIMNTLPIRNTVVYVHTCQLSVFRTESPSFSSRQNLRPRRRKSPSFEHRFFHFWAIISYFPIIIPMSGLCKKKTATGMASRRSGSPCAGNTRKKKAYKAHFNPDWV